jgi:peptidyl-prolyl cis-trans isomerase A (cyclophilin A)
MRILRHTSLGAVVFLSFILPAKATLHQDANVRLVIATELGNIEIEINTSRAPITSANFLKYVDQMYYEGGVFHRSVTLDNQPENKILIEVIQASINPSREKEGFPPIELERTNRTGLKHLDGTISMARLGPDTAKSDFFICIGDQPSLDFGGMRNPDGQGFAAFGRVIKGMEIVRRIQKSPVTAQKLTPPIKILKIHRI